MPAQEAQAGSNLISPAAVLAGIAAFLWCNPCTTRALCAAGSLGEIDVRPWMATASDWNLSRGNAAIHHVCELRGLFG